MMKKTVLVLVMVVAVCFVYAPLVRADNDSIEVITGTLTGSYSDTGGDCYTKVSISGSGDIVGNSKSLKRNYSSQCSGPEKAQADAEALADMASSLGCAVGDVTEFPGNASILPGYKADFVCQGKRQKLIRVMGQLFKQALLLSQPAP